MSFLWFYKTAMALADPLIHGVLNRRAQKGKEDMVRLPERLGVPSLPRPDGPLIWIHAASIGESQSLLKLAEIIGQQIPGVFILVTTITTASAAFLAPRLPACAFHQYLPVDQPQRIRGFLDHWRPDLALWAESELWPNILTLLRKRHVPVALLNARLSDTSFKRWKKARESAKTILSTFAIIMCQTEEDKARYMALGGRSVIVTDNIKYGADPLSCDAAALQRLRDSVGTRPVWLFASTHKGEEEIALKVHKSLTLTFPDLLTVIVPRHPSRRDEIRRDLADPSVRVLLRGENHALPARNTGIYLADTVGELGLFYRLCPLTCMGRSLSRDGGGGHNPLEAALLGSAVLHGPHVQNLRDIYDQMNGARASRPVRDAEELAETLRLLLSDPFALKTLQESGLSFAQSKAGILRHIAEELEPLFLSANLPPLTVSA